MRTHVALLRGINVGGHNHLSMPDLREVMTGLGHTDVATYVQSGNVVFTCAEPGADTEHIAGAIERAIADTLGVRPRVVVLTREDLAQTVADNPYPDETNPKCVHGVFRAEPMGPDEVAALDATLDRAREKGSGDEAEAVGRTLFLHTPNGVGGSELVAQLGRAGGVLAPGAASTARNWATVVSLAAMLEA